MGLDRNPQSHTWEPQRDPDPVSRSFGREPVAEQAEGRIKTDYGPISIANGLQYTSRMIFDHCRELRGTVGTTPVLLPLVGLDPNNLSKFLFFFNADTTKILYVGLEPGSLAGINDAASMQIGPVEGRGFFLPRWQLSIVGDTASTPYRITYFW